MSAPLVGQTQGKYRVLAEIGRGGMAVVYKAQDTSLGRPVAVKVLAPHLAWDTEFVRRFHAEARAIAALRHPNIVTVYEIAQWGDRPCLVMEYLDGRPLSDLLRQDGPVSPPRTAHLLAQVAQALDYAHGRGVIHRDVKPANIIVDADGHATLTDFGLAKALEGSRLTQSGVLMGTPAYLSPEQAKGAPATALSDQYSLAVVAYEMLSGRVPFQADTAALLVYQHVYEPPPDLRYLVPDLPPATVAAVNRALAKDPAQRFPGMCDFGQALVDAAHGAAATAILVQPPRRGDVNTPPRPATPPPPTPTSRADRSWLLLVVALLMALGIGGLIFTKARDTVTGGASAASVAALPTASVAAMTPTTPTDTPTLALTRAAMSATPAPSASVSVDATVNADNVNLRPDPSARNVPLGTLDRGEKLTLRGRSADGQWLYVTTPKQQQGWVAVRLVDGAGSLDGLTIVTPTAVPATATMPAPTEAHPPTATVEPSSTAPPPVVACTNDMQVVAHVRPADNGPLMAGQTFAKAWSIKNTGSCPWVEDFQVAYEGGDQMGAKPVIRFNYHMEPGQTDIVTVDGLRAPTTPGTYSGSWRLRDANGNAFGESLLVRIVAQTAPMIAPTIGAPALPPVPAERPAATPMPAPGLPLAKYPSPLLYRANILPEVGQNRENVQVILKWDWPGPGQCGPLGPNEHFDLRVWIGGQSHNGIAWMQNCQFDLASWLLNHHKGETWVYWSVAVIRGTDGKLEQDLSDEARGEAIRWVVPPKK